MIDHRRCIELAAIGIDFPLGDADARLLDEHLRGCAPCRAEAAALRGDSAALIALPPVEPPGWVRRAIGRRYGLRRGVVLLAAAVVLAVTVGVALAVGANLQAVIEPTPSPTPAASKSTPTPFPSASPSSTASPTAAASPSSSPSPSPSPSQSPSPSPSRSGSIPSGVPAAYPVGSGTAWMGAGPDGGTWLLTRSGELGVGAGVVSTLGLVDSSGRPRPGWPIALPGWRCGEDSPPHGLAVAADGAIRLVCVEDTAIDGPHRHVAFAFDSTGPLPGWPVELGASELSLTPVVVGDELVILADEIGSTDGSASTAQPAAWWLIAISAAGEVRIGQRYEVADAAGSFDVRLAANGIAYRLVSDTSSGTLRTLIDAFDLDGGRPGWPASIPGRASQPVVGPDGSLVVVRWDTFGSSTAQTWAIDTDGVAVATSLDLPVDPVDDRTGAGAVLLAPIVSGDGSLWVVGTDPTNQPAVVRVVPGVGIGPAIPLAKPLQPQGLCDSADTGCGVWRSVPVAGADGTLYVPESAVGGPGLSSSAGGSLVAIAPNGKGPSGWPIDLPDPMAGYWSLLLRADGTMDVLTVTPTGPGDLWSLAIIRPDGTTAGSTVLVEPS